MHSVYACIRFGAGKGGEGKAQEIKGWGKCDSEPSPRLLDKPLHPAGHRQQLEVLLSGSVYFVMGPVKKAVTTRHFLSSSLC